jgi:hypothetical protein
MIGTMREGCANGSKVKQQHRASRQQALPCELGEEVKRIFPFSVTLTVERPDELVSDRPGSIYQMRRGDGRKLVPHPKPNIDYVNARSNKLLVAASALRTAV